MYAHSCYTQNWLLPDIPLLTITRIILISLEVIGCHFRQQMVYMLLLYNAIFGYYQTYHFWQQLKSLYKLPFLDNYQMPLFCQKMVYMHIVAIHKLPYLLPGIPLPAITRIALQNLTVAGTCIREKENSVFSVFFITIACMIQRS